jgi:hypothetical protein
VFRGAAVEMSGCSYEEAFHARKVIKFKAGKALVDGIN